MSRPEIAVRAEGLTRRFETVIAVDRLDLALPAGTVFGFLGPNAAGKTTAIRLLLGLLKPTDGCASVLGHDVATEGSEVRRSCGVVLEHTGLYERLSAAENLEYYVREILWRGASRRGGRGLVGTLLFPVLFGLVLGIQAGHGVNAIGRGLAVFPVGLLAMSMAGGLITDAVAGERERHTLETLLASPVSDIEILAGKMVAVAGYAWGLALIQLVVIGVASAVAGRALPPALLVLVGVFSLLEAVLAAAFGLQFSLKAPTVRAAARKQVQYSLFVNLVASAVNVVAAAPLSGAVRPLILAGAFLVLVGADAALIQLARSRFRRGELLLD